MRIYIFLGLIALALLGLVGCASVDNDVKVPPGSFTSHVLFNDVDNDPKRPVVSDPIEKKLEWLMPLVEIDTKGFIYPEGIRGKNASPDKSPVYVAYDISRLEMGQFDVLFPDALGATTDNPGPAAQARNALVLRILYLSDKNFDAYTLRAQTFNDGEKLASDSLNTVGTGTVGGVALVNPPAAAGIAMTKLLIDSTNTNVQNSFLGGQTVDALFKAMAANRAQFKTTIINKLFGNGAIAPYKKYPIFWALDDIRELNRISTLHGALEDISQKATTQVQAAQTTADTIGKTMTTEDTKTLHSNLNATPSEAVKAQ